MIRIKKENNRHIEELIQRFPSLGTIKKDIVKAYCVLEECYREGGKVLVAGNGGSASDSQHMVGELMKQFRKHREIGESFAQRLAEIDSKRGKLLAENLQGTLPAITLTSQEALSTAYLNDVDGKSGFAQQMFGYGKKTDVFVAISTSGNSENILRAAVVAKAMEIRVVGLTGGTGGELKALADVSVIVPETETYLIQELHLPIYHCWCMMLEETFF